MYALRKFSPNVIDTNIEAAAVFFFFCAAAFVSLLPQEMHESCVTLLGRLAAALFMSPGPDEVV